MSETIVPRKVYLTVWIVLMCLTALTAIVSFVNLHQWSAAVALLIASFKALLVAMFFMHLRYMHQKIIWAVAIAGVFWLSILFVLSMSDYLTRGVIAFPGK
jgi:cytochrome c oxidase subunit IV